MTIGSDPYVVDGIRFPLIVDGRCSDRLEYTDVCEMSVTLLESTYR